MSKRFEFLAFLVGVCFFFSCNDMQSKTHGPIVLGDSSIIITEKDTTKLQDMVTDLKPVITRAVYTDTPVTVVKSDTTQKATDTPQKEASEPVQSPTDQSGPGLKANFGVATVLIPNLDVKLSGDDDLTDAYGASYSWVSGKIDNNLIKVSSNVTKVSQRYQTVIVLKNEMGVLSLESLLTTTSWEPLKGHRNVYRVRGLDEKSLDYKEGNKNTIRKAVVREARKRHYSRSRTRDWENSVKNIRKTNQKPLYVVLSTVMWKIEGKDKKGKPFTRQIRIDIPH